MGLWDRLRNATIKAAIVESPSVATASGWSIDDKTGEAQQQRTKETEQLADNLEILATTADILMDPSSGS